MTRWMKRIVTGAVSAALVLALAAVPGLASGGIDAGQTGTVQFTVTDEADHLEDLAESTVQVGVYKVADVDGHGVFTLTEPFAALSENEQWNGGVLGPETRTQDLLDAALGVIRPEEGEDAEVLAPDSEEAVLAVGGELTLGVGLYVLLPQGVETASWTYEFSPLLLAVPSTVDGQWTYELPVTMKPEREARLTELVIDKTLDSYNATLGPTTFVFSVEAGKDGEVVYSNVVSLTFSGTGTQSVTVSGIPVGADVTVTEVYSGASYTVADGRVSVEIESLPLAEDGNVTRVPFTNTYDEHLVPDVSVVNTFVFNGTGWEWTSQSEEG